MSTLAHARTVLPVALLAAAVLGLTGCGSNSATATSDPVTTTPAPAPTTSVAPPVTTPPAAPSSAPSSATAQAPSPASAGNPGATLRTGPDGSVRPVPPTAVLAPGAPGTPPAVKTPAEARFAATLEQNGVQLTQDGSTEVNVGRAVCQGLASGSDGKDILPILLAIGQSAQSLGSSSLTPQQYAQLVLALAADPANCN